MMGRNLRSRCNTWRCIYVGHESTAYYSWNETSYRAATSAMLLPASAHSSRLRCWVYSTVSRCRGRCADASTRILWSATTIPSCTQRSVRHRKLQTRSDCGSKISDVVFEARPWLRGALRPNFTALTLALRAALTIFWHHFQTQDSTTTAKVKLKVCQYNKLIIVNSNK